MLGPRNTLTLGAMAYPLFAAGFWIYDRTGYNEAPIAFGAVLGVGAGFLWSAAGLSVFYSHFVFTRIGGFLTSFFAYQ